MKQNNAHVFTLKKALLHLKTILTHKMWVFYYCCKLGIPWQGITHDLSKFSPVEFWESIKYYNGKSSPINYAENENGYSKAWLHHYTKNPHHYEHWIYVHGSIYKILPMPYKYVLELVADYLAAGRTYNGSWFTPKDELMWWLDIKDRLPMHHISKDAVTKIMSKIADGSFDFKDIKLRYNANYTVIMWAI